MAGKATEQLLPCCLSDAVQVVTVGYDSVCCLAENRPNVKRKVSLAYINYKN